MDHSVYVFNIMVTKFTVNIACYMLHFEAVCIKPLQYHMYGLFLLSLNRARPLGRTARLRHTCGVRNDYNLELNVFSGRMETISEMWGET